MKMSHVIFLAFILLQNTFSVKTRTGAFSKFPDVVEEIVESEKEQKLSSRSRAKSLNKEPVVKANEKEIKSQEP